MTSIKKMHTIVYSIWHWSSPQLVNVMLLSKSITILNHPKLYSTMQLSTTMGLAMLDCLSFDSSLHNFLTQLVSLRYTLGISLPNIFPVCLQIPDSEHNYHGCFGGPVWHRSCQFCIILIFYLSTGPCDIILVQANLCYEPNWPTCHFLSKNCGHDWFSIHYQF